MKPLLFSFLISGMLLIFSSSSCRRDPLKPDFEHAGGYVIGKEACKANPDEDYWLIDLSYFSNLPDKNYGDTITVNGVFYSHMVKTKQLLAEFKQPGKKLSFDFHLSPAKVQTTGCTVVNPVVYDLKEMEVIASGEIR